MLRKTYLAKVLVCLLFCTFLFLLPGCAAEKHDINEESKTHEINKEFKTIDSYTVTKIVVDELYLQNESEILNLPTDKKVDQLLVGKNGFFLTTHFENADEVYGDRTLMFWSADNHKLIDTLKISPSYEPKIEILQNNLIAYEDDSKTFLAQVKKDGINKIATFDLKDYNWNLEKATGYGFHEDFFPGDDWKEAWKSFEQVAPMAGPNLISIQIAEVEDYIIVYPDYSNIFDAFEVPPTFDDPFFKVFQFNNNELELVANNIFPESLYSTDVAAYPNNRAMIACGEKGFILLDLDDFSYKILQAGGSYLPEEHRMKQLESGLYRMNAHHFYNITPSGVVLAKTWLPAPVCPYSDLIHLWAPFNDTLKLLAESSAGIGADGPFRFEKEWWLKGKDLLILKEENIQEALENENIEDLPEIISYFESDYEKNKISGTIDQALGKNTKNGSAFLWQSIDGENPIKVKTIMSEDSASGIAKISPGQIDILLLEETTLRILGRLDNTALDMEREKLFIAAEEKVYILDLHMLFASVEAEIEEEPKNEVVVNVDVLHLRSGPGTDHEILARLRLGTILEVTDEQDEWLQVNREQGWVHGDYVVKPEIPDKLYEVLPVEVQPVGYSEEQVAIYIEDSTSFHAYSFILPEFDHPNEISNEDLISAVTLNGVAPSYFDSRHAWMMTGKDVQETARSIFGPDLNEIEHKDVWPYDWNDEDQIYKILAFGPSSYTETKVLNVKETNEEFIVDAVHLVYYYNPQETEHISHVVGERTRMSEFDSYEGLLENSDAVVLVDEQHDDGTIDKHIYSFPVRRYILSKEGDGVCYIRQSYLLDD